MFFVFLTKRLAIVQRDKVLIKPYAPKGSRKVFDRPFFKKVVGARGNAPERVLASRRPQTAKSLAV